MKKNKFNFLITLIAITALSHKVYSGTCLVDTNPAKNKGYCVEGVDGKGKCIILEVEDADACSSSEPLIIK